MQAIFESLTDCDKNAETAYNLKHGILMENAGMGMAFEIRQILQNEFSKPADVQIVCGSGDNGGDGLVLARLLYDYCNVRVVLIKPAKSELCKLQFERLKLLGIEIHNTIVDTCDILVDCFLGTGLKNKLNETAENIIKQMNTVKAKCVIACDIPSGLNLNGILSPTAVNADITYSMGALKKAFYSDAAKSIVGKIKVLPLGLPQKKYELDTNIFLLEKTDMCLPSRMNQNTNKGSFGHAVIYAGDKLGACNFAGLATLKFGAGLLTVITDNCTMLENNFMYSNTVPEKCSALGAGPGLGSKTENVLHEILQLKNIETLPVVFDADFLKSPNLNDVLSKCSNCVITPHAKEFQAILKNLEIGNLSVEQIQNNRFKLAFEFSNQYPKTVLLLKGANTIIAYNSQLYVNTFGSNKLSKAGTGDVLCGMILALLAQGYNTLEATITSSLAHSFVSTYSKASYSLLASELIENLELLEN